MNCNSKGRTAMLTAVLVPAMLSTRGLKAASSALAVGVTQEGYVLMKGSNYSFGYAFNVGSAGTEVTALDVALQADQTGSIRIDGSTAPPGMSSAPVRVYSYNSATKTTVELENVTIPATDPMSPFSTGGGPRPGAETPMGPVITYNQYELPTPLILYPATNVTYYVATDVPITYQLYEGTDGYPGSAHGDPAGAPYLYTDSSITFLHEVCSTYKASNFAPTDPTADFLSQNVPGFRGGFNANLEVAPIVISTPANLNWINASGNNLWDTASQNFNNASGTVLAYSDTSNTLDGSGDNVTFNDSNGGADNYNVSIASVVHPTSTTVSNSAGNYLFNGAGGISGPGGLVKTGTASLTLATLNTYTGVTNISGGTLILGVAGALPSGTNLNIGSGATVFANNLGSTLALQVGTLSVAGKLDLNNNALIAHNSSIGAVTAMVASGYHDGAFNGPIGIVSTAAASNSSHATALGVIQNSANGTTSGTALYSTFEGQTVANTDVLVKYTYFGDANLDGKVDGSDYSRIDRSFLSEQTSGIAVTGWYNGDFNYDSTVDGSDYTLIDNAFNTQGAVSAASISAISTAQIAGGSAVPEPCTLGLIGIGAVALLGRRRCH